MTLVGLVRPQPVRTPLKTWAAPGERLRTARTGDAVRVH